MLQEAPRPPQDGSKRPKTWAKELPKEASKRPASFKHSKETSDVCLLAFSLPMAIRSLKMAPRCPKEGPKRAPRRPQERPRALQ
eukprot:9466497-Pyramimonas_sp.AAC.1